MGISAKTLWYVYFLSDPRDGIPRYVGWTVSPRVRLRDHVKPSRINGHQAARDRWIATLVAAGVKPLMVVIEAGFGADWREAERKWIAHFRSCGQDLLNHTDGGEGTPGRRHTAEARAAMSAKRRGRRPSQKAIEAIVRFNRGTKRSAEHCAKMSAALKGRKKTETHRMAMSEAAKRRPPMSPERIEKLRTVNLGKKRGPMAEKTKQKLSEAMKGRGSERKKGWWASLTREQRSEVARKSVNAQTPQQLSERARKGHLTRRTKSCAQNSSSEMMSMPSLGNG